MWTRFRGAGLWLLGEVEGRGFRAGRHDDLPCFLDKSGKTLGYPHMVNGFLRAFDGRGFIKPFQPLDDFRRPPEHNFFANGVCQWIFSFSLWFGTAASFITHVHFLSIMQKSHIIAEHMKIISWNVNGIRAVYKKGELETVWRKNPDILFINETKAHPEQLPPELQNPPGYYSYFNSATTRKGYSGVAMYTKEKPDKIVYDFGMDDKEGRYIEAHFGKLAVIGCYFPNGGGLSERLKYKLRFYEKFLAHMERLRKNGHSIIFCGDVNVAHREIDIARPKENENHVGFLPEERAWIDELEYSGYVDIWRQRHPDKVQYSWWDMKTRARDRNIGWRIDYFFVSQNLVKKVKSSDILENQYGSDHCPIELDIEI